MDNNQIAKASTAVAGASLVAAIALAGVVPAAAQTPPAPTNNGPTSVSTKPLVNSGHKLTPAGQSSKWNSITLRWKATKRFVTLQTSTAAPVMTKHGWVFTGGPVQPVIVKGTPLAKGGKNTFSNGKPTYAFTKTITGLTEHTEYYSVTTVPLALGYKPVQQAWGTTTKIKNSSLTAVPVRKVRMTVGSVKVIKDGDTGIRGKGEVRFGVRLAPEANPLIASTWGSWSHSWNDYTKADSGDTVKFRNPLVHEIATKESSAFVEVQGYENDVDAFDNCAIEGGENTGKQYSDKCFDASVAQGSVKLKTKKHGVSTQYVTAKVYRGPALQFTAVVKVESWFI